MQKPPEKARFSAIFPEFVVLMPSQRRHPREAVVGRRSPHLEIVFQRDLLEVRHQGVDLHCQRPGSGSAHAAHMPVAVRPERGAARSIGSMPRSGRLSVSVASLAWQQRPPRRSSAAARSRSVPTLPGETSTWNIAASVWMWTASGASRERSSARRRREAPAGDDGKDGEHEHAFEQDRTLEGSAVFLYPRQARA